MFDYQLDDKKFHIPAAKVAAFLAAKPHARLAVESVRTLFEQQVLKTPQAVAVEGDETLTYQALNERANQLAHYLVEQCHIEADDRVALVLDRSSAVLIAMLAVLKAGGGYVPIDPDVPDERISHMLADSQPKAVLTQRKYQQKIASLVDDNVVVDALDDGAFSALLARYGQENPKNKIRAGQLAYVIYTSGTTGKPKGVMIEHGNLVHFLLACTVKLSEILPEWSSKSRNCLCYSNYAFDAHIYEVYSALIVGHTLFIATGEMRYNLSMLKGFIEKNDIHIACIPPILLEKDNLIRLEMLSVVGETANQEVIDHYLHRGVMVVNGYGPTETTVCSNIHLFSPGDKNTLLGHVLCGYTAYIVDEHMQLLPAGAVGELYLTGAGISRGYLNNPELTAQRYLPNPFRKADEIARGVNARIYKTGDLVRRLPNGQLEYLGRNDCQVKIRGYRIELEEISARLSAYPGVLQAIVMAKQHASGMTYLAAYYLSEQPLAANALAEYLAQFLPDYMVPAAYVHLTTFPMTISGKLDRRALPEPELTERQACLAPENELETSLRQCYATILGLEASTISVEDSFFRLGGNSILAIKLVNHINNTLNVRVKIAAIFSHSTIRSLAASLNALNDDASPIVKVDVAIPQEQRLSFAQERLRFIDLYEEKTNAYNIPLVFRLKEGMDPDRIQIAIQAVIHRHEVLRSLIKTDEQGNHYQEPQDDVLRPFNIATQTVDSEAALRMALSAQMSVCFDLAEEYPIKAMLYSWSGSLYMSIVVHHIAFDGWSGEIFIRELLEAYERAGEDKAALPQDIKHFTQLLPALPIQYKDFALWQRDYLTGQVLQDQLDFWIPQLSDYEELNLPTDKPRPHKVDYRGEDVTFSLDSALSQTLRDTAKEMGISLYALLLSGYYILLSSYSNQTDIVVGSPIANRNYTELTDIIGFFVNSLALRRQVEPDTTLYDFVKQVSDFTHEVQRYQLLPFEKLVDVLGIRQDTSRHPVFQTMFSVQTFGREQQNRLTSLLEPYDLEAVAGHKVAKFDLTMILDDSGAEITGVFNYASSLFYRDTMTSWITTYQLILSQLATLGTDRDTAKKIGDITLLSERDYQKIVHDWNDYRGCITDSTLIERFEQQVARFPHRVATMFRGQKLTYLELDRVANRLANFLIERYAIRPGDLVALALERSMDTAIAILAVLKSGAAYVPIAPDAPQERMAYILKDTSAKVALTHRSRLSAFDTLIHEFGVCVHALDDDAFTRSLSENYAEDAPAVRARPESLAYIIYTSGTTGTPKGVMVEHHSVVHLFDGAAQWYDFNEHDVWTLFHSYVFDFSVWEFWGALLYGGQLVIPSREESVDISQFCTLCSTQGVTILNQTPSAFYQFIDSALRAEGRMTSLRYVIFGGESLNVTQLKPWYQRYPETAPYLVNMYGITETTIFATSPAPLKLSELDKPPLIGHVLPGYTGYVLNGNRKPLPVGAIGELYLGGDGVTRGYLNNPTLTQQRFIANPFQSEREKAAGLNSRLYKSGDLVKYTADGQLEYIGRNDFQVKIRGFRIELEEIESRLSAFPEIRQSVVLTKDNQLGEKYLVAWYVSDQEIDKNVLVNYLSSYLPYYSIPSCFVQLNRLPLTINGKLNRHLLPEPVLQGGRDYTPPENDAEAEICRLFAAFLNLKVEDVGAEDNYFELGGNSISATRLIFEMNQKFAASLKIVDLFLLPTPRQLASLIVQQQAKYQPTVQLNAGQASPIMLMVHPGGGGCEAYLELAKALETRYSCYGLEPYNLYHQEKIDDLPTLAGLYLDNVSEWLTGRTVTLLGWSLGGLVALEMAAILERRGITDIKVYVLDTILNDKANNIQVAPPGDEEVRRIAQNYQGIDVDTVKSVLMAENKLTNQSVSSPLEHTQVILYKAMLGEQRRREAAPYGYDRIVRSDARLTIINMNHSTHDDILSRESSLIVAKILDDAKDNQ